VGRQDHVDQSKNLPVDWTFCENNFGMEIIQGTNADVAHLLCGFSINIGVRTGGVPQQEQNLAGNLCVEIGQFL
jgi:hypothetical protein